jgi:hypothetical protein
MRLDELVRIRSASRNRFRLAVDEAEPQDSTRQSYLDERLLPYGQCVTCRGAFVADNCRGGLNVREEARKDLRAGCVRMLLGNDQQPARGAGSDELAPAGNRQSTDPVSKAQPGERSPLGNGPHEILDRATERIAGLPAPSPEPDKRKQPEPRAACGVCP